MKRRLALLGLAVAAVAVPFSSAPPAQAVYCDELDAVCYAASITCTADDTLANKSAVYKKYGPRIECLM